MDRVLRVWRSRTNEDFLEHCSNSCQWT